MTVTALGVGLIAWQAASLAVSSSSVLPPPARVLHALVDMSRSGELAQDVAASLRRILTGFLLALFVGAALGVVAARYIKTYTRVAIVLELLSSIPPIAWTPLAILWFGIGDAPAYFIVFLGAFFPLFTSVYAGITQTEKKLVDAARTLGASRGKIVFGIILPSALPSILTGMKTAVGVGWFNVIAAELIGVRFGLGYKIQLSRTLLFSENVIALMLVIGVIGWVMVHLVGFFGNLLAPWRIEDETRAKWIARRRWVSGAVTRALSEPATQTLGASEASSKWQREHIGSPDLPHNEDGKPVLTVSSVCKSYPIQEGQSVGTLEILKNIDFFVKRGEVFTIVGPNGSGKTTLIRLLAGLETPDSGIISCQEQSVAGPDRNRTVIFQDFALFPWRTAAGNIDFALSGSAAVNGDRQAHVAKLLDEAGLARFGESYPAELSGGMKQRLALVRALAVKPTLILMDEPFASLDPLVRQSSQEAILSLLAAKPVTVVLVTHDLDEAIFMSNRVLVLSPRPGRIKKVVPIDLPAKRNADTRKSPEFNRIRNELWDILRIPMWDDEMRVSEI
ncbi:MAG: ATP-binding cassette domain-containing protein [Acidobacteria bacterium]|nr:ATP-binding cassette domain-containing protein [Acidobacteriota bacterium]MCI0720566.1 ATP-binding cassette domain-containing protein [Acidobacteriota bacterium]